VEIGVRNEGRGIPQIERQFIFGPFVRGTSSGAREGTGLGLFIASRLVQAHGGRIWAESEDDGVTFRMSLPGERRWEQRFVS
jgi:signal transduction histidine kinase